MTEIKCYTAKEAAAILKIHYDTLRRYIQQGKVNAVKLGTKIRITEDEINRLLNFR